MIRKQHRALPFVLSLLTCALWAAPAAFVQTVTYKPYIQPGDNGAFGHKDQALVAWQTDESSPSASAYSVEFGTSPSYGTTVTPQVRVVDNYLAADPILPVPPTASGPHANYSALLATGLGTLGTFMFANGTGSWLDTHLTSESMSPVFPTAGSGPKITARFKAKLFSFADILVKDNKLTLYQISEPLLPTSSASSSQPAPFGTDVNGTPVNDPIPDTLVDPATGNVVSPPADGPSALLDKFVVTKPSLEDQLSVRLHAPESVVPGSQFAYLLHVENHSIYGLNGTQAVFELPRNVALVNSPDGNAVQFTNTVVVSIGRLAAGAGTDIHLVVSIASDIDSEGALRATALVRSSTALPVYAHSVHTQVSQHDSDRD